MASDIAKKELDPAHVVGHSLGGGMALKLALEHGAKVKSLTLINSAGIGDLKKPSVYDQILCGERFFQVDTFADFDCFLERLF